MEEIKNIVVSSVNWERATLYLHLNNCNEQLSGCDFYAVNCDGKAKAKFFSKKENEGICLSLNITNPGYDRCLPAGQYTIKCFNDTDFCCDLIFDDYLIENIGDLSRSFMFANSQKSYIVNFYAEDKKVSFNSGVYKLIDMGHESEIFTEKKKEPNVSSSILSKLRPHKPKTYSNIITDTNEKNEFYKASRAEYKGKVSKQSILFLSEQHDNNLFNQNALHKRMLARKLDERFDINFFRNPYSDTKTDANKIKELISLLAYSDFVILEDYSPMLDLVELSKDTTIIQLWHAGAGFKSAGYCRFGVGNSPTPYNCYRQITYGIAGSEKIAPFFAEVFGINCEQIIPTGMPRMDEYLSQEHRANVTKNLYKIYPFLESKRVILFAPTLRGKNINDACYPTDVIDFDKLYNSIDDDIVVLFKFHPWVKTKINIPERYKHRFFDFSGYENINDLFYITDLLITDYSSNIYEFSLMKKPMLFFAFDEVEYSASRGFHRNYHEAAPGKIVHTFDELCACLRKGDFEFKKVQKYIANHFDVVDSNSCDRVIDWLILGNLPDKYKNRLAVKQAEIQKMINLKIKE